MPTADAFDQAALIFDRTAAEAEALVAPIRARAGFDVLSGSRLADAIDDLLDDGRRELGQIAESLRDLRDEARNRAAETRAAAEAAETFRRAEAAYAIELAAFAGNEGGGTAPVPPIPPPPPPAFADLT